MSDFRTFSIYDLRDLDSVAADDLLIVSDTSVVNSTDGTNWKKTPASSWLRTQTDEWGNTVTLEDGYWEDLRFPVQGINPAGSASPPSVDQTTFPGTLLFAGNADNHIAGVAQIPHAWHRGTAIRPHIHWAKTTTATGDIAWRFRYTWSDIGATFGAYTSWLAPVTGGVGHDDTTNQHALTVFPDMSPATGVGESSVICWELMRDVSEDAVGDAVRLFELDFHYQTNKSGTRSEVPED